MKDIKLLALDLDGTLLDNTGDIPKANLDAIRRAEDEGVLVTIATGRRFRDALPVAKIANLNAPVLSHNGGLTKSIHTLETIRFDLIPPDVSRTIVEIGSDEGGDALVSADPHGHGTMFYESISGENSPLRKYIEWATRLHGDDADESVHRVDRLAERVTDLEVIHISYSGTCEPMGRLEDHLKSSLKGSVNIVSTVYPHLDFTLIDILPKNVSKAAALQHLCEEDGIKPNEVMAIGDNFNDLEMLEFAGVGVVMGNADSGLRSRKEFYTTVSNEEAGVAAAVNQFILEI